MRYAASEVKTAWELARNVRRQAPILLCMLRFLRRHGGSHAFDHHVSVLVGAYGVQLDDILSGNSSWTVQVAVTVSPI